MAKRCRWILLLVSFAFQQSGCVSGSYLKELKYSLDELRHAISAVAVEVRWSDDRRRRFESRYFVIEEEQIANKKNSKTAQDSASAPPAAADKNSSQQVTDDDWEQLFEKSSTEHSTPVEASQQSSTLLPPPRSEKRAFARFFIAGDRRPYQVVIQVIEEEKIKDRWKVVRENATLAARLVEELKTYLEQGRVERNAIDSFRPF